MTKPLIKWSGRKTYLTDEIENFIEKKYKKEEFSYHLFLDLEQLISI